MDQIKIGNFLQSLRKSKGLTQIELADKFNISNKTVSKWECGESLPEITLLKSLAEFYDITVDEILNAEKNKFSNDNVAQKNKMDIFYPISLLTLILGYLLLYVLGYTTTKSNIACFISILIYFIASGILIMGTIIKNYKLSFNKLYIYSFLLIFFTTSSIAFYNIPMDIVGVNVVLSLGEFLSYSAIFLGIEGLIAVILYLLIINFKKCISVKIQFYTLSVIYIIGLLILPIYNSYHLLNLNVLNSLNFIFYIAIILFVAANILINIKFKHSLLISWILLFISFLLILISFYFIVDTDEHFQYYISLEMSLFLIILPIVMLLLTFINYKKLRNQKGC